MVLSVSTKKLLKPLFWTLKKRRNIVNKKIDLRLRLEPELHELLKKTAAEQDRSMNWLAAKAIEEMLKTHKPCKE